MKKDALHVEESTPYDNLIDDKGKMVSVIQPLLGFGDDDVTRRTQIKKIIDDSKFDPYFKSLKVKFTCADEVIDFQRKFCLPLTSKTKSVVYPFDTKLCGGDVASLGVLSAISGPSNWGKTNKNREWKQMPEFIQPAMPVFYSIDVKFRSEDNLNKFARILGDEFSVESLSIYFKPQNKEKNSKFRWIEPGPKTYPQYPVYIISKGRSDSMLTSRALASMDVPHYIAIEPQDRDDYEAALERFGIEQHVTLLNLPFSNHGNGPGRARNWCWDHSNSLDTKKHWVLDDNIHHFYRLNRNNRYRVDSGAIFRAAEDFVDRYENVPVSGFQYRHFISPQSAYPAFVKNTRIYSTLLIDNKCPHRWRGRYNEDTILSLDVLSDPSELCTIQFNAFLQAKAATQTVKGGNTEEYYHAEHNSDKTGTYNPDGTMNKSVMLYRQYPDVTKLEWKYRRWHHQVNYSKFKKNKLRLKSGVMIHEGDSDYGMELIDDYSPSDEIVG